jgi:hypothetical protein
MPEGDNAPADKRLRCGGAPTSIGVEAFRLGGTCGGWQLPFGGRAEPGENMLPLETASTGDTGLRRVSHGGVRRALACHGRLHAPGRIRTFDLGIKSPLLYQLSYGRGESILHDYAYIRGSASTEGSNPPSPPQKAKNRVS